MRLPRPTIAGRAQPAGGARGDASRGQSLVLVSLTMLVLAMMVLLTLGLSVRIHEKQELQTAADAAAYSEAVATARAYNAVAAENRVLVAEMASIAAAQSMLSWVGFYHGTLNQARDLLADLDDQGAACGAFGAARTRIMSEDYRLIDIWEKAGCGYHGVDADDFSAADYIRDDLYVSAQQIADNQKQLYRDMTGGLSDVAASVAEQARAGDPFGASAQEYFVGPQAVTRDEHDTAVVAKQQNPVDLNRAVMATRGLDPFISARIDNPRTAAVSGAMFIERRLQKVIGPPLIPHVTDFGTSYFGDDGPQRSSGPGELEGYDGEPLNGPQWVKWKNLDTNENVRVIGAWAQDSGRFWFEFPGAPAGCVVHTPTEDSFGYLVTTGPNDRRDNHMWRRGNRGYGDYREWNDERHKVLPPCWPEPRHTFHTTPADATDPLAIFPVFTDFNADTLDRGADSEANVWGQPKSMVAMRRDYAARRAAHPIPDPWELQFRFTFAPSGSGSQVDTRNERSGFERAISIASGLTYYHRGEGHSREPPNFLNPFWRATLTASDVDLRYDKRGDDAKRTLNDLGEGVAADTLRRLQDVGFEAMP